MKYSILLVVSIALLGVTQHAYAAAPDLTSYVMNQSNSTAQNNSDYSVVGGQPFTIFGRTFNTGGAVGSGFSDAFIITNASNQQVAVIPVSAAGMAAGYTWVDKTASYTFSAASTYGYTFAAPGVFTMKFCADYYAQVGESDETNNCNSVAQIKVYSPQPDYMNQNPASGQQDLQQGDSLYFNYWTAVTNNSFGTSTSAFNSVMQIYASDKTTKLGQVSVDRITAPIKPGGYAWITTTNSYQFSTPGTYYIRYCFDSDNEVQEVDETNNCGFFTGKVIVSPRPDVTSATGPEITITAGSSATMTGITTNNGGASTGTSFHDVFYIYQASNLSSIWANSSIGPFPALGAGASASRSGTYTFWTAGTYYYRLCADGWGEVTEADENNNCGAQVKLTVNPPPAADLTATIGPAVTTVTGQVTTYTGTIMNTGPVASTAFTSALLFYTSTTTSYINLLYLRSGAIASGGSNATSTTYTFATPGTYYYRICTDWYGNVTESDEGNNCSGYAPITVTAAQPDLTAGVTSPTTATSGSAVTITSQISNTGLASTGSGFYSLFQKATDSSGTGATDIGTAYTVSAIAASSSAMVNLSYTFPTSGTFYLRACADKNSSGDVGTISESSEGNNCSAWVSILVSPGPQPDLTAGTIGPTTAVPGTARIFSATISNNGSTTTGTGFTTLFQKATDSSGTGATDIGTFSHTSAMAVSGSQAATLSYTFATPGTYYMRACADKSSAGSPGTITESNEGNNCGAWIAVTVAATGTLSCNVSNTSPEVGETITYTATPSGGATGPYAWTASDGSTGYGTNATATRTYSMSDLGASYGMTVNGQNVITPAACMVSTVGCAGPHTSSITATPNRVVAGNSTTLTYTASGVNTSCTITGNGVNQPVTANSCAITPTPIFTPIISTQTVYTITCDAGLGSESHASVIVNVVPIQGQY